MRVSSGGKLKSERETVGKKSEGLEDRYKIKKRKKWREWKSKNRDQKRTYDKNSN